MPRLLSSLTDKQIRALPLGTRIEDPDAPNPDAWEIRARMLGPRHRWVNPYLAEIPALSMGDFIRWEVPRQGSAHVIVPRDSMPAKFRGPPEPPTRIED